MNNKVIEINFGDSVYHILNINNISITFDYYIKSDIRNVKSINLNIDNLVIPILSIYDDEKLGDYLSESDIRIIKSDLSYLISNIINYELGFPSKEKLLINIPKTAGSILTKGIEMRREII